MVITDDYAYDDGLSRFDDYVPKTVDPGNWMLIGSCSYSVLCLILLPILVICGNRQEKRRLDREEWKRLERTAENEEMDEELSEAKEETAHIGAIETELVDDQRKSTKIQTISSKKMGFDYANIYNSHSMVGSHVASAISNHSSIISGRTKRHRGRSRLNYANLYSRASESEEVYDVVNGETYNSEQRNHVNGLYTKNLEEMSATHTYDDIRPEDAADANDPGMSPSFQQEEKEEEMTICFGKNSIFALRNLRHYYGVLADIAHIDNETKRIIQLGWPMTLSAGIDALFELIGVAIVANYLGNRALMAYVITDLLVGLTDTFLAGPADALNTVCAHAVGAENYKLAGQYVQIAAVLYFVAGLPLLLVWYFWIADVARLMGFDEEVVALTAEYTKIHVWLCLLEGLFDGYNSLLDVTGYVLAGAIFDIIFGLVNLAMFWVLCAYWEGITLYWLGFAELMLSILFFIIFTAMVLMQGWLSRFTGGIFDRFAMCNTNAVKNVLMTSIPLSFGSLLEYGEWEALTFFVAYLGNAEVAAWGLLETIWEFFEAATEGLSEASSIRVAYHLGNGNIEKAKMSTFKSLFLGVSLSFFITAFFFILGEDLATWLTPDVFLQDLLNDCIPMIGIANIFMIFGMTAWTLVGAQGRYRLATIVSACMSFFVTIPLAALSSFYFMFDLKGIVAAVICGYSSTALWMGYILLRSDWEHISETIQEYNAEEESSSDDESSSESSSSSSSDDSSLS